MANRNFRQRLKEYKRSPLSGLLFLLVCISALLTVTVLVFLIIYILYHGIPNLTLPGLFDWEYNSENVSMMPAIILSLIHILNL